MKNSLLTVLMVSVFFGSAQADEPKNTFGLTLDPLMVNVESATGDRSEKHNARVGLEYTRTLFSRLDVFAGTGFHRVKVEEAGVVSKLNFFDARLGVRQYFSPRAGAAWSPFIDASIAEGWLEDSTSTVGGSRRYGGWNASVGASKYVSENTDFRIALGYSRFRAKAVLGVQTDTLSSAEIKVAVASRF